MTSPHQKDGGQAQPSPGRRGSKIPSPFRGGTASPRPPWSFGRAPAVWRGRGLKKLPRSFYLRPTVTVAKDLLGKYLVRKLGKRKLIGKIVEAEAYCEGDPASHSYRGRTKRNDVMFWDGGHLYVYFTYGMHFCANVVTRGKGVGEAVLIRAVEPVKGLDVIRRKRRRGTGEVTLMNGPAKFCEAFGIQREQNGIDLCRDEIFIANGEKIHPSRIASSKRIGIQNGGDKKWRFYLKDNQFLSRKHYRAR